MLKDPFIVADKLPDARAILVTAGGEGASFVIRPPEGDPLSGFVEVYDVDVFDTTGAGDAFTAGFIYGLLQVPFRVERIEIQLSNGTTWQANFRMLFCLLATICPFLNTRSCCQSCYSYLNCTADSQIHTTA